MEKETALKRPPWIKVRPPLSSKYFKIKGMLNGLNLATVCQEAHCPNMEECWGGGTATFMLLGDTCTRACKFCAVKTGNPRGALDEREPQKVGYAISQMNLDYVVLTSVDRDDLPDQGAGHFAQTVQVIKANNPRMLIEILAPDFRGEDKLIEKLVLVSPNVFAHNMETIERLTPKVRDRRAGHRQSLKVLKTVKNINPKIYTKTSLMLGLGETRQEVEETLHHLRLIKCDIITFGQYLSPSPHHLPVSEYITPKQFQSYKTLAEKMGFLYVASGPLVRSSYRAGELFMKGMIEANGNGNGS